MVVVVGLATMGTKVKAVHTNAAATRLGAIGSWAAPRGTDYLWRTAIAGTTGGASIVVTATTQSAINVWHTQVTRTLSVTADPGSIRRGGRVTFTVADAGDPVAGARVRFGSRQGTTNGAGKVTLAAPGSGGRVQVTASKGIYNDGLCIGARALTAAEQSPARWPRVPGGYTDRSAACLMVVV